MAFNSLRSKFRFAQQIKMAASQVPNVWRATAKPILSSTFGEARRRAINLYRAWYREVSIAVDLNTANP